MTEQVSILIADDHQMIIDGIRSMLSSEKQYAINASASDGKQAWALLEAAPEKFQVLITDVGMPHISGIELCRLVKAQFPEIKVLILSMYSTTAIVKEAIAAEADGYMLKSAGKEEFLNALHRIHDGGTYFAQELLPIIYNQIQEEKKQSNELSVLTLREQEVLALIMKEHTSEEIAVKLFISKKTVDVHRQNILSKTKCRSTVGLVKFGIRNGLS
jgi:DNA-binding NarL/FixJ family response regulator